MKACRRIETGECPLHPRVCSLCSRNPDPQSRFKVEVERCELFHCCMTYARGGCDGSCSVQKEIQKLQIHVTPVVQTSDESATG